MATRKDVHIGQSTYYIRKYEPFLSLKILGDLQKRFLGPMAVFMEAQQEKEMNMALMVEGVTKISATLDGDSIVALTRLILNPEYVSVSIGSEPAEKLTENVLNKSAESVSEVIELLAYVLVENYSNVFTLVKNRIGLDKLNGEAPLGLSAMTS